MAANENKETTPAKTNKRKSTTPAKKKGSVKSQTKKLYGIGGFNEKEMKELCVYNKSGDVKDIKSFDFKIQTKYFLKNYRDKLASKKISSLITDEDRGELDATIKDKDDIEGLLGEFKKNYGERFQKSISDEEAITYATNIYNRLLS